MTAPRWIGVFISISIYLSFLCCSFSFSILSLGVCPYENCKLNALTNMNCNLTHEVTYFFVVLCFHTWWSPTPTPSSLSQSLPAPHSSLLLVLFLYFCFSRPYHFILYVPYSTMSTRVFIIDTKTVSPIALRAYIQIYELILVCVLILFVATAILVDDFENIK